MPVQVLIRQRWSVWRLLLSLTILTFRFFTGLPLKRERKDNASFWKGATKGKPGKALTEWQKKPYFHRALIRGVVFWPMAGITALYIWNANIALLVLVFSSIPLGYLAFVRGRRVFFQPFTSTDAVNGEITQHWMMRPKWRKMLRRQPIPGQVARKDRLTIEFPAELEETVRKALAAEEDGQGMPPALKVKPYRRR